MERILELAEYALANLRRTGYVDRATVVVSDGTEGFRHVALYDQIIVTSVAPNAPKLPVEQLKEGKDRNSYGQQVYLGAENPSERGRAGFEPRTFNRARPAPLMGKCGFKSH